jgi:hypothetical protein
VILARKAAPAKKKTPRKGGTPSRALTEYRARWWRPRWNPDKTEPKSALFSRCGDAVRFETRLRKRGAVSWTIIEMRTGIVGPWRPVKGGAR